MWVELAIYDSTTIRNIANTQSEKWAQGCFATAFACQERTVFFLYVVISCFWLLSRPTSASHHLDQRGFNSHHSSNSPFRGPASQTPLNYSSIANGQTAPTGEDDIDGGGAAGAIHMQQTHKYSPGVAIPTLTVDDVVEDLGFGMYQVLAIGNFKVELKIGER